MNCQELQTWLISHALAEITPPIQRHLDGCESCRVRLHQIEHFEKTLKTFRHQSVPAEHSIPIWPRVAIGLSRARDRQKARTRYWAIGLPALASVSILALVIYSGDWFSSKKNQPVQILDARLDGKPAVLSVVESTQSDMTLVWLD